MNNLVNYLYNKLSYLKFDITSLSVFRILLALSILYNLLIVKWNFVLLFFGNNPLMSLDELHQYSIENTFSIFNIIASKLFVKLYLVAFLINTGCLLLGYKTKIVSILSVFFQFNLFQTFDYLNLGMDIYNFQLSLWAMFLPLNYKFSLDALLNKSNQLKSPSLVVSIILLVQIGFIYLFTGLFKYGNTWVDGTAVKNMLSDEYFTYGMASIITNHPAIYSSLTYLTLFMEYILIILIFIPFRYHIFRIIAAIMLFAFHTIILFSYDVGSFSFIGIAVAVLLLPTQFWNYVKVPVPKLSSYNLLVDTKFYLKFLGLCFMVFILTERNFYNYYSYRNAQTTVSRLEWLHLPSPCVASPFTQYWRMYAPNPQYNLSQFELCQDKKKIDKANGRVEVACDIFFKPFNTEHKFRCDWGIFLAYVAKNNIYEKNSDNIYFYFFKKWLYYHITEQLGTSANLEGIYLLYHSYILSNYELDKIIDNKTYYYRVSDILNDKIVALN